MANETKTILNVQRGLEGRLPITITNDTQSTLNRIYEVAANETLTAGTLPKIQYFGIGISGYRNISDTNASEPHIVQSTNMDLYTPIPIRCVPIENDLPAAEREKYRMRVVELIGNDTYVSYYLKKLEILDPSVKFTITDENGVETPYEFDYGNLTPTPPLPSVGGVNQGAQDTITVSVDTKVLLTGNEIHEAINAKYDGNLNLARISELGIYQGQDRVIQGNDYLGNTFNYTESIMTQLVFHRTWTGDSMESPSDIYETTYTLQSETVILQS